jgi:hypothetical protein
MEKISKKRVFVILALIVIAITTIAWAQAIMGMATITVLAVEPKVNVDTPSLEITPGSKGTSPTNGNLTVSNVRFNYTVIRVSLVDLGGLYKSMNSFTVTFLNQTGNQTGNVVWAQLTLDEPLAEFFYNSATANGTFVIPFVVSWQAEKTTESIINYGIAAEVVDTYDYKG